MTINCTEVAEGIVRAAQFGPLPESVERDFGHGADTHH
jgi:hypothetical protein